MRKGFRANAWLAAAALALIFSGAQAQETVKIGVVSATTGPLAAPGKFQINGFKLAAEKINSSGGVEVAGKKYKVELVIYDTRCNAVEGTLAFQRLINVDRVPIIVGELCSSVANAEAPIAKDYEVPFIVTVASSPTVTSKGNPYLFRVNANQRQLVVGLAQYVVDKKLSPLSFIAWNTDAGRSGVTGMKKLLPSGFDIGYVGYFNVGDVDFKSHITNIRRSGAKAVMLLMDEEPGGLAINQIVEAGLDIQLIGTLAMGSGRFLKRVDAKKLDGMIQYNAFPPKSDVPRIKAFSKLYGDKYGEESHGFAAQSYDGLMVALEAMKSAGTVTDSKRIRNALAKTDYEGVIGRIKFGPDGQASPPVYITEWCADATRKILFPAAMVAGCGKG